MVLPLNHNRLQGGIIFNAPGVFIHNGKTYWRKETYLKISLKDVLPFCGNEDVIVRSPVIGQKNRYNYIIYMLMWDYEVDIRPDLQFEGSIVMNNKGKKLNPIKDFYYLTEATYLPKYNKWWIK